MSGALLICDLRHEWRSNRYVTFWGVNNGGYSYSLSRAGDYSADDVVRSWQYYTKKDGGRWNRFPVLRSVAEEISGPPRPRDIDGYAGPVVLKTAANIAYLLKGFHELKRHLVKHNGLILEVRK